MIIRGYTPEEQHLSKLEHDPQYAEDHRKKFAAQGNYDDRRDLCILDTGEVEAPIGRGAYWEGQSGWGFFTQLIVWLVLTIAITVVLCIVIGLEFLPPILIPSPVLAFGFLRFIVRRLHGG